MSTRTCDDALPAWQESEKGIKGAEIQVDRHRSFQASNSKASSNLIHISATTSELSTYRFNKIQNALLNYPLRRPCDPVLHSLRP